MSVYVDPLINYGWKYGASCHLTADTVEELHVFAQSIGMKRGWFQLSAGKEIPHYDLTGSKRKLAVNKGAIELSRKEMSDKVWDFIKQIRLIK